MAEVSGGSKYEVGRIMNEVKHLGIVEQGVGFCVDQKVISDILMKLMEPCIIQSRRGFTRLLRSRKSSASNPFDLTC